jgi:hypothetical protein
MCSSYAPGDRKRCSDDDGDDDVAAAAAARRRCTLSAAAMGDDVSVQRTTVRRARRPRLRGGKPLQLTRKMNVASTTPLSRRSLNHTSLRDDSVFDDIEDDGGEDSGAFLYIVNVPR